MRIDKIPCPNCGEVGDLQVEGKCFFQDNRAEIDTERESVGLTDIRIGTGSAEVENIFCRDCCESFSIERIIETIEELENQ